MAAVETGAAIAAGGAAVAVLIGGEAGSRIGEAARIVGQTYTTGVYGPGVPLSTAAPPVQGTPTDPLVPPSSPSPGVPWWIWLLVFWGLSRAR